MTKYYFDTADDFFGHTPSMEVIVGEKRGIYTGLLDAEGRDIYRYPETVKFGFHPREKQYE